ncbi:MAG: DUF2752 domain-containing protein [Phycisphaerales bacterium]|nr:DUF2752 domain-containing protein [Phycisphaerales bacterium]MCB9863554.1 DUF2752 domain-containing protein [Phycisphaerales bacterium]
MPPAEPLIAKPIASVEKVLRWIGPTYRARPSERIGWGVAAAICATLLVIAVVLEPSPSGMGTHQALGLPPCGFAYSTGLPCPTCGMTTSFSLTVRGRLYSAIIAQPGGFALCVLSMLLALYGAYVAARGRAIWINWDRISTRLVLCLAVLVLGGWGFKMAHGLIVGELPLNR